MQKNYKKFLQGAVAFPMMAMHLATTPVTGAVASLPSAAAIFPDQNRNLTSETAVNQRDPLVVEAGAKIDAYFAQYNAPLEGEGYDLAKAAIDNGLPIHSLAAIAWTETGGGETGCAKRLKNPYGYGSCKISFDSIDEATNQVARTLGAKTKMAYRYEGKTFEQKLKVYNHEDPRYLIKIKSVMGQIDRMEVPTDTTVAVVTPVKA